MFKIYNLSDAQVTILKRRPPDEFYVPDYILDSLEKLFGERVTPDEAVRRIVRSVRERGDEAVIDWMARIDRVEMQELAVPPEDLQAALANSPIAEELKLAADRIVAFHEQQAEQLRLKTWQVDGLGQKVEPIERVGVYVPAGTAPLPSSLLMSALPAKVAGVKEIIVTAPPSGGEVAPVILAAAAVCGIDKVYRIGGAQAVAAMAYGTEQVPRVDKIVGPGNLFVTLAKRQVFGTVGVDGLPGPTETMIIADDSANPAVVAADLLAQAEHDVLASAILVTPSRQLADQVAAAVMGQLEDLSRAEIILKSLDNTSGAVIVETMEQAFEVANVYAAEHLCLAVDDPSAWLPYVKNAGGVFMGEDSYEVLGDYVAGPSHTMPTGGTARYASPLNVLDFIKVISVVNLETDLARDLSTVAAALARAEQLTAHAAAAEARLRKD